jgi:uncharacterized protein (TIGR03066 family)
MKATAFLVLAALLTALATSAGNAADKDKDKTKKNSELIVGKWSPDGPAAKGVTIEFTKDGKVKISIDAGGKAIAISGTYKFPDDKTIEMTMEDPFGKGEKKSQKITVKSISGTEMVIVNPEGKEEKMKAVK